MNACTELEQAAALGIIAEKVFETCRKLGALADISTRIQPDLQPHVDRLYEVLDLLNKL